MHLVTPQSKVTSVELLTSVRLNELSTTVQLNVSIQLIFPLGTFDQQWVRSHPVFFGTVFIIPQCSYLELSTVVQPKSYTNTDGNDGIQSHHGQKFQIRTFDHGVTVSPLNFRLVMCEVTSQVFGAILVAPRWKVPIWNF